MGNCLVFVLNFIAIVFAVPAIFLASSLNYSTCERFIVNDLISLGLFLIFVSLIWLIGSCFRMRLLLWFHLLLVLVSLLGIVIASVSGYVAVCKGESHILLRQGIDDGYRVESFSPWMQKYIRDKDSWSRYRACLVDDGQCQVLDEMKLSSSYTEERYMTYFPAEWSCCKPPKHCGYERHNATFWTVPKSGLAPSENQDCSTYSNHQDTLCFDCETCKAGVLAWLRLDFIWLLMFNVGVGVFLALVSCVAFSNLRKNKISGQNANAAGYTTQMA